MKHRRATRRIGQAEPHDPPGRDGEKKAILSADAGSDARFQASESISSSPIRSMMCVPLLSLAGEPMGVINIDTQNPLNQFRKDDLDLLIAVAGQAALVVRDRPPACLAMSRSRSRTAK